MRPIDEKIVALRMENADFEKNAQQSMQTFANLAETFQKSIVFDADGAVAGLKTISSEADKIDFELLNSALERLNFRFSALGEIAFKVLGNLTDMAMDAGAKIAKFLTVDSIAEGWREYNTQIDSTLAIMTNTKFAHPMEEVNEVLDEMNRYSDKTIYNFTQMVQAMGTFTAGGLGLHASKDAIIGLSNFAASVGSTREQYNRVMNQASAAMSTGFMQLRNWYTFERAGGIGGTLLREKFLEEAIRLGKLGDKSMLKGLSEEEMLEKFRFSLKEGWLDREVMTNVFTEFANDPQMMAAATKVRTFKMMTEQIIESMGSGWARALRALVGDLEKATERWTDLTLHISERTDALADAIGDVFTKIAEAGGTEAFFKLIKNMSTALFNFLDAVWVSFTTVFPIFSDANIGKMVAFVNRLADAFERLGDPKQSGLIKFGQSLVSSLAWTFDTIGIIFKEFSTILDYIFKQLFPEYESITKFFGDGILGIMGAIQDFAFGFNRFIRGLNISEHVIAFMEGSKGVVEAFFVDVFPKMEKRAGDFAKTIGGSFLFLKDNITGLNTTIRDSKLGDLFRSAMGVWSALANTAKIVYTELKVVFDAVFKKLFPEANSLMEVVAGGFVWLIEKMTKGLDDLAEGIEKADTGVFKTIKLIAAEMKTVFTYLFADMEGLNKNPFAWLMDHMITFNNWTKGLIEDFNVWLEELNFGQKIVDFFSGSLSGTTAKTPFKMGDLVKSFLGLTTVQATGLLTGAASTTQMNSIFPLGALSETFKMRDKSLSPGFGLEEADEGIKNFGKRVAEVIGGTVLGAFSLVGDAIGLIPTLLAKGIETLKPFAKAAGELAGIAWDVLKQSFKIIMPTADQARSAVEKVVETVESMSSTIWKTAVYIATPAIDSMKDAFKNLWGVIKEEGQPVVDFIVKVKDGFVEFWKAAGFMGQLVIALLVIFFTVRQVNRGLTIVSKGIERFGESLVGMFKPFKNVLKSVSKAFYSMSDMFRALGITITRMGRSIVILNFAMAIATLAASLWLISKIPSEDLLRASAATAGLIVMMAAVVKVLDGAKFATSGFVLVGFAAAILALVGALTTLAILPQSWFGLGIWRMVQIGILLTLAMTILSLPKNTFDSSGFAIIAFGVTIGILVTALKSLSKLTDDEIAGAGGMIVYMMFVLGAMTTLMGRFSTFASVAQGFNMMAMGAAIMGMVLTLHLTINLMKKWDQKMAKGAAAIMGGIMIALGIMLYYISTFKMDGAPKVMGSLFVMTLAIASIVALLKKLSKEPFEDIYAAAFSLSMILLAIGGAFKLMEKSTYEAGLLGIMLGMISHILIPAMLRLAEVPVEKILGFAAAFAVLMAAISGSAFVLSRGDTLGGVIGIVTTLTAIAITAVAISGGLYLIAASVEKFSKETTIGGMIKTILVLGALAAALISFAYVMKSTGFPIVMAEVAVVLIGFGAGVFIMIAALEALMDLDPTWDSVGQLVLVLLGLAGAIALLNFVGAPVLFGSIAVALGVFVGAAIIAGATIYFLNEDLIDQVPKFMATGVALIVAIADGLITSMPTLVKVAVLVTVALLNTVAKAIEEHGDIILDAIWNLIKSAFGLVEKAWDSIQPSTIINKKIDEFGQKTGRGLSKSFGDNLDFHTVIQEELEKTTETLGGTRGEMEEEGKGLSRYLGAGFLDDLNINDLMGDELKDLLGMLGNSKGDMFDYGALLGGSFDWGFDQNIFMDLVAQGKIEEAQAMMESMIPQVESTSSSVAKAAVEAAKAIDAEPAGSNIIAGIVRGLNNNRHKAVNAAEAVASQAIGRVNKTLDSRSPSRVMMQIGGWFTQGFAIGIEKSQGMVDENVTDMVDSALDRVRSYAEILAQVLSDDIEMRPKISPVLNLDGYDASVIDGLIGLGELNGHLDFSDVNAATDKRRISAPDENLQNANNLSITNNIDMKDANFIIREDADIDKITKALDQRVVESMTKKGVRVVPV